MKDLNEREEQEEQEEIQKRIEQTQKRIKAFEKRRRNILEAEEGAKRVTILIMVLAALMGAAILYFTI